MSAFNEENRNKLSDKNVSSGNLAHPVPQYATWNKWICKPYASHWPYPSQKSFLMKNFMDAIFFFELMKAELVLSPFFISSLRLAPLVADGGSNKRTKCRFLAVKRGFYMCEHMRY